MSVVAIVYMRGRLRARRVAYRRETGTACVWRLQGELGLGAPLPRIRSEINIIIGKHIKWV